MILKPIQTKAEGQTLPRLVDYADLLTDEEEVQLTEKLDAISLKRGCDIVVVTVDSLKERLQKLLRMIFMMKMDMASERTQMVFFC